MVLRRSEPATLPTLNDALLHGLFALVRAGQGRFVGVVGSRQGDTLRRAQEVRPLASLHGEYPPSSCDSQDDVLADCRELWMGFVAYGPLGRGFVTDEIRRFGNSRRRRLSPLLAALSRREYRERPLEVVSRIGEIAPEMRCVAAVFW